jgi:adenine-specific DNA-methyltransferase
MSSKVIKNIMQKYGRYDLTTTEYQRFKADSNRFNKTNKTTEYLHILEKQ